MLSSMQLLNSDAVIQLADKIILIKEDEVVFNPLPKDFCVYKYGIDLNQVINEYLHEKTRFTESLEEFYKAIRRSLIKESFEVVKAYAEYSNSSSGLKCCPWYQFARILRNAISHDFHFRFNKYDLTLLPLTWHNVTIQSAMHDQQLSGDVLSHGISWDLYNEMVQFVNCH